MSDLFKDLDFYYLDELFGPEEKMARDSVRQFVQQGARSPRSASGLHS